MRPWRRSTNLPEVGVNPPPPEFFAYIAIDTPAPLSLHWETDAQVGPGPNVHVELYRNTDELLSSWYTTLGIVSDYVDMTPYGDGYYYCRARQEDVDFNGIGPWSQSDTIYIAGS